jgi:poly-gamma-glutamate capsule biosynthesis protein CapA/YwtB (metallophosphatase superfamily)
MRLLFVGDVMLGRLVNRRLHHEPPAFPWGDTLPLFDEADARICNLECVLSDRGTPWTATPKTFHFRSDAKNVAVLRAAHVDIVSLANNHSLDFGYEALADMLMLLDASGIQHAGAGRTLEEAMRPALLQTDAGSVGLLAFTDNEPAWSASPEQPGVLYVPLDDPADPRPQQLLRQVSATKATVDYLVVSAHWGPNWGEAPLPEHVRLGHALIEAGADVVFGHSAHILRGVELYQRKPILYSTGDFIDDYAVDPVERNDESCIFVLEARRHSERLKLYPTIIEDRRARRARQARAARIAAKVQRLCADLGTLAAWRATAGYLEVVAPMPSRWTSHRRLTPPPLGLRRRARALLKRRRALRRRSRWRAPDTSMPPS